MKRQLMRFCALMVVLFAMTPIIQARSISRVEALEIAQSQFNGDDVDYYIQQDHLYLKQTDGLKQPIEVNSNWVIFVDAEPMKGWEHDCYLLTIPKTVNTDNVPVTTKTLSLPPTTGEYVPLLVKNRYGDIQNTKPIMVSKSDFGDVNPAGSRTYALIISGGISPISNHERYWNDCSFIYQTLTHAYHVPKENIYPIMSDGTDPGKDMRLYTGGEYVSQPLDLDGDGRAEIEMAATKANIKNTLKSLESKVNEDDHLFIFVIDHGGSVDMVSESYICLWGNERLYDHELADMLTPFSEKYANINVVLGQCYAGGFIDDLTKVGCVVAAACSGSESSWACPDIPYDEL